MLSVPAVRAHWMTLQAVLWWGAPHPGERRTEESGCPPVVLTWWSAHSRHRVFAGQLLLPAQHHPRAREEDEGSPAARLLHVPEGGEGHAVPGAPAGSAVCRVSLEAQQQGACPDLRLPDALSDSLPGEEANGVCVPWLALPVGAGWSVPWGSSVTRRTLWPYVTWKGFSLPAFLFSECKSRRRKEGVMGLESHLCVQISVQGWSHHTLLRTSSCLHSPFNLSFPAPGCWGLYFVLLRGVLKNNITHADQLPNCSEALDEW